jgi:predicted nucleotidyltransferase
VEPVQEDVRGCSFVKRLEQIERRLAEMKSPLRKRFRAKRIGIFGSYVGGKAKKGSDLDVLVEFETSASLSLPDFIALENYLSDELGVKVDLVERTALKPRIGKHIMQEVENV